MPVEVIMPKVDMDMASGKISVWHVAEGEAVAKGDPLFDIETDKAAMEVESPGSGTLHHPAAEGSEVPIGTTIAWLYAEGEEVGLPPEPTPRHDAAVPARPEPEESPLVEEPAAAEATTGKVATGATGKVATAEKPRATPLARSLAREAGLDLERLSGTGARGRIQGDDVRALLETPQAMLQPAGFTPETGPLSVTRSKGGTGTPIVLLHGFAGDSLSWAPLETHLKGRPLIRIDLPCHGKSPKLLIDSFADLVREVRRAFDDLDIERAHLVGHSLGGALAMALADTRPRKLASVALLAPAGLGPDVNGDTLFGICRATRAASLGPWLKTLVADHTKVTDSFIRLAMQDRQNAKLRAAQTAMANALFPDGVQAFDLRAALARLEMPTRIVWGKADAIIPWQHALRAPGHVALHLFDGIGHVPQFEAPEEVGKIIADLT